MRVRSRRPRGVLRRRRSACYQPTHQSLTPLGGESLGGFSCAASRHCSSFLPRSSPRSAARKRIADLRARRCAPRARRRHRTARGRLAHRPAQRRGSRARHRDPRCAARHRLPHVAPASRRGEGAGGRRCNLVCAWHERSLRPRTRPFGSYRARRRRRSASSASSTAATTQRPRPRRSRSRRRSASWPRTSRVKAPPRTRRRVKPRRSPRTRSIGCRCRSRRAPSSSRSCCPSRTARSTLDRGLDEALVRETYLKVQAALDKRSRPPSRNADAPLHRPLRVGSGAGGLPGTVDTDYEFGQRAQWGTAPTFLGPPTCCRAVLGRRGRSRRLPYEYTTGCARSTTPTRRSS